MTGKQKKPFVPSAEMREEQRRMKERESLFAAIPNCPEKQALRLEMLEAAFWLLEERDEKSTKHSDALMEFMSTDDALKTWNQFFESDKPFDPSAFPAPPPHESRCEASRLLRCLGIDGEKYSMGPRPPVGSKDLRRKRLYARRKRPSLYSSARR